MEIVRIDLWIVKLVPRLIQELFKEGQLGFILVGTLLIVFYSYDGILKENCLWVFDTLLVISNDSSKASFKFVKNLDDVDDVHFFVY